MEEQKKDNEHIKDDPKAFMAAYERAREYFSKFEGVRGVGFGQKATGGAFTEETCIIVFVSEKKDQASVAPGQLIPPYFEGYPTDVYIVRSRSPLACTGGDTTYEHMMGGIQVCVARYTETPVTPTPSTTTTTSVATMLTIDAAKGTMACIVRRRGDTTRDNVYLLSNHHVLYARGGANNYVYHPYPDRDVTDTGEARDSTTLGPIMPGGIYSNQTYPTGGTNQIFLDCAIARIDIDCFCGGTRCTKDKIKHKPGKIVYKDDANAVHEIDITDVRDVLTDPNIRNVKVIKCGAVTKRTVGFIRQINVPVDIVHHDGSAGPHALNTITIEFDTASTTNGLNCAGRPSFAEEGDSGSLVIDEQGRAVGLLFLGPPATAPSPIPADFYFCNMMPIVPVLDKLNICLPITGTATTHGTCAATDGSGQTPAPAAATTGGGVFGIRRTVQLDANDLQPSMADPWSQPAPPSEEQLDRLTNLLQAFRSTQTGRDLHGAFAHVRREIGYLVRNCRPVTVAWHRNKGPAFFACFLNHLRGDADGIPHEIGKASMTALLNKMEIELMNHGSIPLQQTIQRHGEHFKAILLNGNNVHEFIDYLQKTASA